MSAVAAIELASVFAAEKGYDVKKYRTSSQFEENVWVIFFESSEPKLGDHFTVYVNDQTKSVKNLVPGR